MADQTVNELDRTFFVVPPGAKTWSDFTEETLVKGLDDAVRRFMATGRPVV